MTEKNKFANIDDSPFHKQDVHREKRKHKNQKELNLYDEENNIAAWQKYSDFYTNQ